MKKQLTKIISCNKITELKKLNFFIQIAVQEESEGENGVKFGGNHMRNYK